MTSVSTYRGLRTAVKNRDHDIFVTGKVAKAIRPLALTKFSGAPTSASLTAAGITVIVIAAVGIVTIIAMVMNYDIKIDANKDGIHLEYKH